MEHELEEVFAWLEAGAAADYQGGVLDVGSDGRVQILNAIRSAYIEFQSTGDQHELVRAVGNILDA